MKVFVIPTSDDMFLLEALPGLDQTFFAQHAQGAVDGVQRRVVLFLELLFRR
jgi:hypothetical protein